MKRLFFFSRVVFFFSAPKIEWMNGMWTFPGKKKHKKTHKFLGKKKQNHFLLKKIGNHWKSEWMTDELFLGKKKNTSLCFFFPLFSASRKKKHTIFRFEWMNDQRPWPRKKKIRYLWSYHIKVQPQVEHLVLMFVRDKLGLCVLTFLTISSFFYFISQF